MDILAFVFGILTILGLLAIVALVVGTVKIVGMGKRIKTCEDTGEGIYRDMAALHDDVAIEIKDEISAVKSYVDSRIDKLK